MGNPKLFCFLLSVFSINACQKQSGKLPDFGLWPEQGKVLILIFEGGTYYV